MTLQDYFTTTEVENNYGEHGIEQGFLREFIITSDFFLEGALRDLRNKNSLHSLDRIGANMVSLTALVGCCTDIAVAIPLIVAGMSEVYRFRQYRKDMKYRKRFENFRRETVRIDLTFIEMQREEFKTRSGLEAPF